MSKVYCPIGGTECDPLGTRGLLSHLHHKHGYSYDDARDVVDDADLASVDGGGPPADDGTEKGAGDETSGVSPASDGGTESVEVSHEGTEKLSPSGFEDESTSAIDPPEGVTLPEDVSPDDFEPVDRRTATDPEPEPQRDVSDTPDSTSDDGLLSRIRGGNTGEVESPGDVVNDADDEEERDRRREVLEHLESASQEGPESRTEEPEADLDAEPDTADDSTAGGSPSTTTTQGMVVDDDLVASLFGMPFAQAAEATGWEGWRLSAEEKRTNARLLVAYCDSQNIDLSEGTMLAMSLMSTVGGRAAGYAQYRRSQGDGETTDAAPERDPTPDPEAQQGSTDGPTAATSAPDDTPKTAVTDGGETGESDGKSFDFADSSTW